MDPVIDFRDQKLINFRCFAFDEPLDHGFRWIAVKRFQVPASPCADTLILRSLIGEDQFADGYAGGGVDPTGEIHGPYRIRHITAEAYDRIEPAAAISRIEVWATQHGSLPEPLVDALEKQVYAPIRDATSLYRLNDLGRDSFHDWGGVHSEFHELVVIDRAECTLLLVVAADD